MLPPVPRALTVCGFFRVHVATQSTTYKVEVDKVHLELEEWQRLIEHQRTAISLQEIKVEKADTTVDVHRQEKEHFEKRCAQLEEDVLVKEKTIAALHQREQHAHEQIRAVEHLHHRAQKTNDALETRCQNLERQSGALSDQVSERMAEINSLQSVKKQQRSLQGEVDRMKDDNARLVKMLKSTKEYADFVQRAYEQSDVAYLQHGVPLVDLRIITEDYGAGEDEESDRPLGDPRAEFAHWMPADIHAYAQECRKRYLPETTDVAFGNFLHSMHLRWRNHEQRLMDKRALAHDRETTDLQRRVQQQKPYNVTKLEEEVRSLRKQLKHVKVGVGPAVAANEATRQSKEKLLEWSLATVEDLAHQVSTMGAGAGKVESA